MDDATLEALRTAASAVFDVGFATMVGALASPALLHDATSGWAARRVRRCRALFTTAAMLALAASIAWIAVQAVSMADLEPGDAWQAVAGIVVDTAFGRAWAVATLALAAGLALAAARRYRALPLRTLALLLVVVAAAHASAGHAGANGFGWLVPAMTVHLLATGLWVGGVFAAALVVLRGEFDAVDCARYAARLSALATASLAGVVATGGAIAWHALGGSLAPLAPATASAWGILLDTKLALIAAAVALGGFNRFFVLPSLPGASPRFARVLRLEAAVLLAALVAAAWLANGEPPAA
jgi:putative copper resistance protein D